MSDNQQSNTNGVKSEAERKQDEFFKKLGDYVIFDLCGGDEAKAWRVLEIIKSAIKTYGSVEKASKNLTALVSFLSNEEGGQPCNS